MHTLKKCCLLSLIGFSLVFTNIPLRAAGTNAYFSGSRIDFMALLPPPPASDSVEQAADLAEVRTVSRSCDSSDAALARSETKFTAFTFGPEIQMDFQPEKFPHTAALFARVQKTASASIDTAKDFWKRPRPFIVDTNLTGLGEVEKSFSYPSGHSTRGTVYALVLADLFPEHRDAILAEGRNIGWHRVEIARHYPTDIFAGRVLAQAIYHEMKTNPDFQSDFAAAKAEVSGLPIAVSNSHGTSDKN